MVNENKTKRFCVINEKGIVMYKDISRYIDIIILMSLFNEAVI